MVTILQVLPGLQSGGVERTAVDISNTIVTNGWRSVVASSGGRMVADVEAGGGTHIELPLASKNPLTIWRNIARLQAVIAEHDVSLVHARSRAPAWSALAAARRAGLPFVTTYAAAYNQNGAAKRFYNSVMARGDTIIANSSWTAQLVRDRVPDAAPRVVAIPRGVDLSDFDPATMSLERRARLRESWGVPEGARIIAQVSRMTRLKGHATIIDAAPAVLARHGDVHIVLAGGAGKSSDYIDGLRARIAELGLADRIHLPGHCDDPAAAAAIATIMVQASTQPEAFGRTPIEAAAMNTPVIATGIGAVSDTIITDPDHARTGWTVPPADPAAMADALNAVLDMSPEELAHVTQRARTHAHGFSLSAMGEATLEVYRGLLSAPR